MLLRAGYRGAALSYIQPARSAAAAEMGSALEPFEEFLLFCLDLGLHYSLAQGLICTSGWSLVWRDIVLPQQLVWCWQINSSLSFSLGSIHSAEKQFTDGAGYRRDARPLPTRLLQPI